MCILVARRRTYRDCGSEGLREVWFLLLLSNMAKSDSTSRALRPVASSNSTFDVSY